MTVLQEHRSYRIGSPGGLRPEQMEILIEHFKMPPESARGVLGGRIQAQSAVLPGVGPVVIKHYYRGGIIRHINRRTYLQTGIPRSRAEYELLEYLPKIGVQAPEPAAYAFKGSLLYHAWLVTKELHRVTPLSEVSRSSPQRARDVMPSVVQQVERLVQNGIHHVDLHPGNILVNHDGDVYFIDFDKAGTRRRHLPKLRRRYVQRWRRAVRKYGLPPFMDEMFAAGIAPE